MVLFVGVVAAIVGIVGLLVPVSVGEEGVSCGSAAMPDYSEARAATDFGGVNIPVLDEVLVNPDYVALCDAELRDRRTWTITLTAVGAIAVIGALVMARRSGQAVLDKRR